MTTPATIPPSVQAARERVLEGFMGAVGALDDESAVERADAALRALDELLAADA